jgi:diacylglycerol kinase family enzyme
MTKDKAAVLFNPSAGRGKAMGMKDRVEACLRENGVPYDLFVTGSEEELRALAREHARNRSTVVGAGGDSTFHLIVNEIVKAGAVARFGMIGVGSSNDIDREFNVDSLEKACRTLKRGWSRRVDLGCIVQGSETLRYFLGQANVGLGAQVNGYVEALARRKPALGRRQTLAGVLGVIRSYRSGILPLSLTMASEAGTVRGDFVAAVFSNIRYWATGKLIAPEALPDDGSLDACLIGMCSFGRLARIARLAGKGRHGTMKEVRFLRSSSFEVSSETPFEVQTDGEIIGGAERPETFERVTFKVLPRALDLVC